MRRVVTGMSQDIRPGLREAVMAIKIRKRSAICYDTLPFTVCPHNNRYRDFAVLYPLQISVTSVYRYTVVQIISDTTVQPVLHEVAVLLQVSLFGCNR